MIHNRLRNTSRTEYHYNHLTLRRNTITNRIATECEIRILQEYKYKLSIVHREAHYQPFKIDNLDLTHWLLAREDYPETIRIEPILNASNRYQLCFPEKLLLEITWFLITTHQFHKVGTGSPWAAPVGRGLWTRLVFFKSAELEDLKKKASTDGSNRWQKGSRGASAWKGTLSQNGYGTH